VSVDGRVNVKSGGLFPVEVRVSEKRFRLMQNPDHSHFGIVRDKLKWGDPAVRD
jgi:NAD kinase